jgi:hypothetical protein
MRELDDAQAAPPEHRAAGELNLAPAKLYEFITSDFESAWAAFAAMKPEPGRMGRANMLFARQAMTLLEFAGLLYEQDAGARRDFSEALIRVEPRYFTTMPGACVTSGVTRLPFDPRIGPESADRTLLAMLFDMTRHGLSHQYQTITVRLLDRRVLAVRISGPSYGETLSTDAAKYRDKYLSYLKADYNDMLITLYPDYLYLDIREAISVSKLLDRGLVPKYFERGGDESKTYQFDAASLESALKAANHIRVIGKPGA